MCVPMFCHDSWIHDFPLLLPTYETQNMFCLWLYMESFYIYLLTWSLCSLNPSASSISCLRQAQMLTHVHFHPFHLQLFWLSLWLHIHRHIVPQRSCLIFNISRIPHNFLSTCRRVPICRLKLSDDDVFVIVFKNGESQRQMACEQKKTCISQSFGVRITRNLCKRIAIDWYRHGLLCSLHLNTSQSSNTIDYAKKMEGIGKHTVINQTKIIAL